MKILLIALAAGAIVTVALLVIKTSVNAHREREARARHADRTRYQSLPPRAPQTQQRLKSVTPDPVRRRLSDDDISTMPYQPPVLPYGSSYSGEGDSSGSDSSSDSGGGGGGAD